MKEDVLVVIPARLSSTRLPKKVLLPIHGYPMIYWVVKRVLDSGITNYIVATDSSTVMTACEELGINVMLTSAACLNGTERVAEVAREMDYPFYCNVQGDEPLLESDSLAKIVNLPSKSKAIFYQGITKIQDPSVNDVTEVKAALGKNDQLHFFSRSAIPYSRGDQPASQYRCLGLYLYSRELLLEFVAASPGELELSEQVEQLRCIENNIAISAVQLGPSQRSVDTIEDYDYMCSLPSEFF